MAHASTMAAYLAPPITSSAPEISGLPGVARVLSVPSRARRTQLIPQPAFRANRCSTQVTRNDGSNAMRGGEWADRVLPLTGIRRSEFQKKPQNGLTVAENR